jgi:CRP-like cAMP-binding protein
VLAGQAFANLSRPPGGHTITVSAKFAGADAPDRVCALLVDVADDLPQLHPDGRPIATAISSTDYTVTIPVRSPADDVAARSTYQRWLWYASRRAGVSLDGIVDDFSSTSRRIEALRTVAPVLRISPTDMEALLPHVNVFRYGSDELMQKSGDVPASMSFIVKGRVRLVVMGNDGAVIPISTMHTGDFIGQTALTREPVTGNAYAVGEVTVLQVDRDTLERLVFRKPELLQDLSRAIDERRKRARTTRSSDQVSTAALVPRAE